MLTNKEKTQPEPRKPLTPPDMRTVLGRGTAEPWSVVQCPDDQRFFIFDEAYKAYILRARAKHILLLSDQRVTGGQTLLYVVGVGNEKNGSTCVAGKRPMSAPQDRLQSL
ncbi:hypothetical protein PoB_006874300 [Plakobranchus ocellatus]|uniref:Uncharacterized protein n=1 Tax=Plakobranchus ocellatus TaxID=259542 RepID=A0AAV4DDE2_9GAST|nr:hypothetical protein PoB_006874300 [Plakobranchus ocellatus]